MITCFVTPEHCELCMHFLLNCAGWYVFFALCGVVVRFWDCTRSTTPDIHHIRQPPHQTSTTPCVKKDTHHTRLTSPYVKKGHPPHHTSTTPCVKRHPDIHHKRPPLHLTSTTPDIHHIRYLPHHV